MFFRNVGNHRSATHRRILEEEFLAVTVREPQILHAGLTVLMEKGGREMKVGRGSSKVERNLLCEQDVGFLNV
jgi:hypothetical protein